MSVSGSDVWNDEELEEFLEIDLLTLKAKNEIQNWNYYLGNVLI